MALGSKIEWTESTWNPVTGCTKISDGCKHCYAERLAIRLQNMGNVKYANGFNVTLHEDQLNTPLIWKKPSVIFVNSMSDLFHEDVPLPFIQKVFNVMEAAYWHQFQILTKRAERLMELAPELQWPENVWQGVTVEGPKYIDRIDCLRNVPAKVRFISFEPLLDEIPAVDLSGIHWAIVGGESGPNARPMEQQWVMKIKQECETQGVPFYFKQWGGVNKHKTGRILLGQTWDEQPRIASAV